MTERKTVFATLGASVLALVLFAPTEVVAEMGADDRVILSVSGRVAGGAVEMTLGQIDALGNVALATTTPWHDGIVVFEGPLMRDVMAALAAEGESVEVEALNGYTTDIPLSDFEIYDVVLAHKRDGRSMPVSDKGPLFIVYPYDSDAELHSEIFYARSAWQVRRMTID